MERDFVLRGFKRLQEVEPNALRVIYWRCKENLSINELKDKLSEIDGVVYSTNHINNYLRRIYDTFYLDGIDDLPQLCPDFYEVFGDPPDYQVEIEPPLPPPPIVDGREPIRPSHLRKLWNGLIAVVTGAAIFFIGYFSGLFQPGEPSFEPTAIVVTQIVTQIATSPPEPTEAISQEPTQDPDIALVPTDLPEPTEEHTPEPTNTPEPTVTPTPSNVYFDDLSNGIDESIWDIQYGRAEVVDARTQIVEELYMVAGDGSWQNYEIRMQVVTSPEVRDNICVRCSGTDGVIIYFQNSWTYPDPGADIGVIESGNWRRIKEYQVSARNKILTVQVQGDNVQAWLANENILDYVTEFESGYIGLELHPRSHIEWIEVTRLD